MLYTWHTFAQNARHMHSQAVAPARQPSASSCSQCNSDSIFSHYMMRNCNQAHSANQHICQAVHNDPLVACMRMQARGRSQRSTANLKASQNTDGAREPH